MQLDEMLGKQGVKVDKVLNFAIADAILEERITGHWINSPSGRIYHTKFAPSKVPGTDDVSKTTKFLVNHSVTKLLSDMFYQRGHCEEQYSCRYCLCFMLFTLLKKFPSCEPTNVFHFYG